MHPSTSAAIRLFLALQALPFAAAAQPAPKEAPPPKLEKLEEGATPPDITVRSAPENRANITEKRAPGGRRTEVQVTRGKNTYYVKPNEQAGSAVAGDAQGNLSRPAQWQILNFDGNRPQKPMPPPSNQVGLPPPDVPNPVNK